MTQPDPNANGSQNPEPDSSEQRWLEELRGLLELVDEEQQEKEKNEQERRKWEELMQQTIEEQERLEREQEPEQLDRDDRESELRLLNWWLEQERLEQEQATWNQEGNSDNFAGYRVRRPDGTWYDGGNESPVGQDRNAQGNSDNFAGYRVRRPDGTWYDGGNESPVGQDLNAQGNSDNFPGRGRRLGTDEPPPGYERGENTPEQPTITERRAAALAAIERRQVTDRSKPTRDDQSQSHGR
jgi:hypothetical protein